MVSAEILLHQDCVDKDIAPSSLDQLHPGAGCCKETLSSHDTEKGKSSFDMIVFNRCPRSPWIRLVLSQTPQDFWDGTLWHSLNSRYIPLRKAKPWELNNIFNDYKLDIGWRDCHFRFRWQFTCSDGSWLNAFNTNQPHYLWGNWRNRHSRERRPTGT